ncbi:hypothetical protein [Thiococcus pfennigii]|uniref:hypothetical protein n=1 Tax=Thiococcus pfennigii TaxID=1057 RepID=UPI0019085E81|nr:hypothetical protein [Thiococcus pfennigii]
MTTVATAAPSLLATEGYKILLNGTSCRGRTQQRAKKKEKILSMLIKGDDIPNHGTYPGLGERWNRPREEQTAVLVPAKHLQKLAEKIVKGIAFIEDNQLIDSNTEIEHHIVNDDGSNQIEDLLKRFGTVHSRGPGIKVVRAVTPEDGVSAFYKITVWGEIVLYVSVTKKIAQQMAKPDPIPRI